ncbi:MAG TPA: hypothetical protein VNU72_12180 [Puia sp.]|jgi:hypothetical protein|nr:hypothetical protein [Puia sp.]
MKKIPSFTIMELAIALLISSVVISTGYYVYLLMHRQFDTYRKRAMEIDRYHLLAVALQNDFDRSASVERGDDDQLLCKWTDTLVSYSFLPGNVVRTLPGGVADSFRFKTAITDIRYVDDSLPLVDGIRMQVEVDGEQVLLLVQKMYSSQEILDTDQLQDKNTPE